MRDLWMYRDYIGIDGSKQIKFMFKPTPVVCSALRQSSMDLLHAAALRANDEAGEIHI